MGAFVPPTIEAEPAYSPGLQQQPSVRYVRLSISGATKTEVPPLIPFTVNLADQGSQTTYRRVGYAQARADPPPPIITPPAPTPLPEWWTHPPQGSYVRIRIAGQTITAVPPLIVAPPVLLADHGSQITYRRTGYVQARSDLPPPLIAPPIVIPVPAPDQAAETASLWSRHYAMLYEAAAEPPEFPPSALPLWWTHPPQVSYRRARPQAEPEARPPQVTVPDLSWQVEPVRTPARRTRSIVEPSVAPIRLIAPDLSWMAEAGRPHLRRARMIVECEVNPPTIPPPPDLSWMPRNLDPPLRYLRAQPQYVAEVLPIQGRLIVYLDLVAVLDTSLDLIARVGTEKFWTAKLDTSLDLPAVVDRLEQT